MNNKSIQHQTIQHHTLNDLVALVGEQEQGGGIHVFAKENNDNRDGVAPIQYPFRSDHFSVFVITDGELAVKLNLFDYRATKNDVLVVAPNVVRQFMSADCDFSLTGIIFTADFLMQSGIHKKYIEPFDFFATHGNPHLQVSNEDATSLTDIMKILLRKNVSKHINSFGPEIVQHYFTAFMYELAAMHRKYNAHVKIKLTRKEDLAMRFLKLLPQHFREERSVQFYADLLYVTPKYLTQSVKEIAGKTAGECIDEVVIMEAKVLLSDMTYSIAQVAEALFFSDQFFFSKFFKNHTGTTPTEYRKTV